MQALSHNQILVECLEIIQSDHRQSASSFLQSYFQRHRFLGSRDRRAITDDVYRIMRSWCGWKALVPDLTIKQAVDHFMGSDSTANLPELGSLEPSVLKGRFSSAFWQAMGQEAPWDLRINPLVISRDRAWKQLLKSYPDMMITPWSPWGLRLTNKQNPEGLLKDMLVSGALEVQDEGSQLISLICDAQPGMRVWDACAGAGGKALALGACMKGEGCLVASDNDLNRLQKAQNRMQRAGLHRVQYQAWQHVKQMFDRVLVDAPCSGTGTWRRHPELAMRFTMPDTQNANLLQDASLRVKKGGWLVYSTCSILHEENEDVVESFISNNSSFDLLDLGDIWRRALGVPYPATTPWLQLTPQDHYTDGFFIAVFVRKD